MGRLRKGQEPVALKSQKISVRVDEQLRRDLEEFSNDGICRGEELQVIIRMLVRAGMEVERRMKVLRAEAIQELAQRGAESRAADRPSSARARGSSR